ncbi:hypothetical protein E2C01_099210 [Portunus trituberculatus]|uniref:Uncharacterized protein n=1 Tax=Portunus trituberculatus TaxID=210409 RepID=A0A5B7KEU5_PORTR|nr:hypothetical protein [Portunus trituberculatus]
MANGSCWRRESSGTSSITPAAQSPSLTSPSPSLSGARPSTTCTTWCCPV